MFSRLVTRTSPALSRPLRSAQLTRPLVLLPTRTLFNTAMTTDTITQAIAEDHREMYTYYDEYVKASGDKAAQERWANQFMWEVARHAIGEEIVVYPLMEKHLGQKGKELADQDRTDHQYVKDRLYTLERTAVGTAEHSSLLKDIVDHLRPHNDSEEQQDLPLLENVISREDSMKAAKSFTRTKKFVPTRSHPSAPNKPPFETLAGLMAAPMDKIKDMFASFPSEEEKDAAMKGSSHN